MLEDEASTAASSAEGGGKGQRPERAAPGTQFTCFTSTKVSTNTASTAASSAEGEGEGQGAERGARE